MYKDFQVIRPGEPTEIGDNLYYNTGTVKGLCQPITASQAYVLAKRFPNVQYLAFFDIKADVKVGDQLQQDENNVFTVASVADAAGLGHHLEVYLEQAQSYIHVPTPLPEAE